MLKIYFVEKELGCFNKTNERYDYIETRLITESFVLRLDYYIKTAYVQITTVIRTGDCFFSLNQRSRMKLYRATPLFPSRHQIYNDTVR